MTTNNHVHEPNPVPPSADSRFILTWPHADGRNISLEDLLMLPQTMLTNCYIVSTGHGTSGPFEFSGPTLLALLEASLPTDLTWQEVEVISADGFGTRLMAAELIEPERPIILAITLAGQSMTRQEGLVRLIVPSERDDALRQVKWVGQINVLG